MTRFDNGLPSYTDKAFKRFDQIFACCCKALKDFYDFVKAFVMFLFR
jgi:hypothetical protein